MIRLCTTSLLPVSAVILAGCAGTLERRDFASRVIADADPDQVFQAAQSAMRREFGRIDVEPVGWRIDARPAEFDTARNSGTTRDLYGAPSTMRRIARCEVAPHGQGSIVRIRVAIERRDTQRTEVFQQDDYRLSDAPSRTPIQRDAATTAEQNTVWTYARRDRQLERVLLAEIEERSAPQPPSEGPTTAPIRSEPPQ